MSAATFLKRLRAGRPLLLDGGLASELERRGASLTTGLWSAELLERDPALIAAVHEDYVAAGADIVSTASYQASLGAFAAAGIEEAPARALIERSVELARASGASFVAGSVGPYGATLQGGAEYTGGYALSSEEYVRFHAPRLEALIGAGVDVIAAETLPVVGEAVVLAALAHALGAKLWLAFSCVDERALADGTPVEIAAALAEKAPAVVAVGVNCVRPEQVAPLLERMQRTTSKPLVAYPNSGEPWLAAERRYAASSTTAAHGWAGRLDATVPRWLALGARIIGGCCRTTPDDTRRLARVLKEGGRTPSR